jgi:hypothetical protein
MHDPTQVVRSLAALTLTSVFVGCASIPATRHSGDPCVGPLAEASALVSDFADSSAARVVAAHSAYAAKMVYYHECLAEHRSEPS